MGIVIEATEDTPIVVEATPSAGVNYQAEPNVAWVVEAVDDWLTRTNAPRRDVGRFHPSDLGQSDDDIIARFLGYVTETPSEPKLLRVFDNGHAMHRRWGKYLKKAGLTIAHTKHFYMPRLKLNGTCDEIIAHPETGEAVIVELKSINPFAFAKLTEPKPEHLDQLHCYLAGLRIVRGIVLYECKGTQAVKLFDVPFDSNRWLIIEERLIRLRREAERRGRDARSDVLVASSELAAELGQPISHIDQHPSVRHASGLRMV